MLKKAEVIAALENGGQIMIDTIYRTARVLDANFAEIGTCRFDTAERIERSEGYKTRRSDWYATRFVEKDWDAASAQAASIAAENINTGEVIEGPARAVYEAIRYDIRSARHDGNPLPMWRGLNEDSARVVLATYQVEEPAQEATSAAQEPGSVSVDELRADLDTGDHGDALNDYRDSSAYICDAIMEAADNRTSIYYSDILRFISSNPEALADVVNEGLYEVGHGSEYDLYKHGQAAEFMTIERDIYDHLDDALMLAALDFIQYDMKRDAIPAELADYLKGWVRDPGDRMSDIPDRIREYFADTEGR